MNRPKKHHAINLDMAHALHKHLKHARQMDIPFLVITSSDSDYFCAGGDLHTLHGELSKEEAQEKLLFMNNILYDIVTFPVPVICLLHGNALGGGCELATACDIRIAQSGTSFGFVQTKVGILPGWGGGTILHEKLSSDFALHWLMTAKVHDATYLERNGWLQHICPKSDWQLGKILQPYTERSKEQMTYLKQQYLHQLDLPKLRADMKKETANCASLWGSSTHQSYVNKFKNN